MDGFKMDNVIPFRIRQFQERQQYSKPFVLTQDSSCTFHMLLIIGNQCNTSLPADPTCVLHKVNT